MNQDNMGRGVAVVVVTAAVCVLPYALIVKALDSNFSFLSIGVGLAVGFAARKLGNASGIVIGVVAALATFAASFVGDCLALKWLVRDALGFDIPLFEARQLIKPMSYLIFGIGAFVAFGAAGGRNELRQRSATVGAGRFTPDMMAAPTPTPPVETPGPIEPK
ncbi:MAG: hypothetical protein QOF57_2591 [Frankiaceae bacterium]|jgi:hypothetical protein|nr:hypothetical protein [Frankiaceae bacterium]MDQ1726485.1 hypothetical protein [Frankiaceae bacterium]